MKFAKVAEVFTTLTNQEQVNFIIRLMYGVTIEMRGRYSEAMQTPQDGLFQLVYACNELQHRLVERLKAFHPPEEPWDDAAFFARLLDIAITYDRNLILNPLARILKAAPFYLS